MWDNEQRTASFIAMMKYGYSKFTPELATPSVPASESMHFLR